MVLALEKNVEELTRTTQRLSERDRLKDKLYSELTKTQEAELKLTELMLQIRHDMVFLHGRTTEIDNTVAGMVEYTGYDEFVSDLDRADERPHGTVQGDIMEDGTEIAQTAQRFIDNEIEKLLHSEDIERVTRDMLTTGQGLLKVEHVPQEETRADGMYRERSPDYTLEEVMAQRRIELHRYGSEFGEENRVIASGRLRPDGSCVLSWIHDTIDTAYFRDIPTLMARHGQDGYTVLEYLS